MHNSGEKVQAEERSTIISKYLNTIIERGSDLSYLISKKKNTDKMIMYSLIGNRVTVDIPYKNMRRDERVKFNKEFDGEFQKATYAYTKEASVEEASEITDRVFYKVFGADDDYSIDIEFELD